jgi:predicted transcriptional regulator
MTNMLSALTRRERHIMDILFRLGRATADEVMKELSGNPSYSTVRTPLRLHARREAAGGPQGRVAARGGHLL